MGTTKVRPAFEGKKIILGKVFGKKKKTTDIIKVYESLVKVLRLVDSDEKPTMDFIYKAIDRAKRAIKENFWYSTEYERIIDNRLNFMHSDMHSAGYFLNPQFQFGVEHSANVLSETLEGTRSVIERLKPSLEMQIRLVNQVRVNSSIIISEWWMIYGICTPELQQLEFKVLKQLQHQITNETGVHSAIFTQKQEIEWLQEKENPLLDGENVGMFLADNSDDEINVVEQS
ncbi:hypothetical protein GQ457_02G030050 [Hibiscus cannabinus]